MGFVKIKTLFTYDLVAEPSFSGARMTVDYDYEEEHVPEIDIDEPRHATNVTKNIESLSYLTELRTLDGNKRFVDKFPKMKHFSIEGFRNSQLLRHISETNINIESLDIHDLMSSKAYFKNLKELTVYEFRCRTLNKFIMRHSDTLERIHFTYSSPSDFAQSTAIEMMKCKNLKKVKFRCHEDFRPIMKILDEVLPKDKSLEIVLTHWVNSTTFKLPEDMIFWIEEIGPPQTLLDKIRIFFRSLDK